jgi:predicted Zn-dependent peptidase
MNKIDEALKMVRQEMVEIQDNLEDGEIQRAKDFLVGRTKLAMDKTSYLASFVGERLLLDGEVVNLEEELEKYKKVTMDEIMDLAKGIFKKEKIREVVIKISKI